MNEEQEYDVVTLTYEDDTTEDCAVMAIFEVEGYADKQYVALMPVADLESEDQEATIYLYTYDEDESGEPILGDIEDDDELEDVQDAFAEIMDEDEFFDIENNE